MISTVSSSIRVAVREPLGWSVHRVERDGEVAAVETSVKVERPARQDVEDDPRRGAAVTAG